MESAKETCAKFAARSAVLATDGFIVYDIQDERGRTTAERPFPFRKTMDPTQYASYFPPVSGKQCVVYKSVVESGAEGFQDWIDTACDKYMHNAFNLVGAPSSTMTYGGLKLSEAGVLLRKRGGCAFGCVAIPERHTKKGNEDVNMLSKVEFGAEWFITQGIFSAEPISKLLNEYGDLCREKGIVPKKVVLTFAPCGRPKTMTFIKWLGMYVPADAEERIFAAEKPVVESITLLRELLLSVLQHTHNSGVPIGVNVESLSIFKDEIDAAHDLFQSLQVGSPLASSLPPPTTLIPILQHPSPPLTRTPTPPHPLTHSPHSPWPPSCPSPSLSSPPPPSPSPLPLPPQPHTPFPHNPTPQATLLNSRGSPWAIRWFPVAETRLYIPSQASPNSVDELERLDQECSQRQAALKKRNVFEILAEESEDLTMPMLLVGMAGVCGILVGRYLR